MSSRSVPYLSAARFMTAWSFIAINGPGSATGVVTSMRSPLDRIVSMVRSVAVSFAQACAWVGTCRTMPLTSSSGGSTPAANAGRRRYCASSARPGTKDEEGPARRETLHTVLAAAGPRIPALGTVLDAVGTDPWLDPTITMVRHELGAGPEPSTAQLLWLVIDSLSTLLDELDAFAEDVADSPSRNSSPNPGCPPPHSPCTTPPPARSSVPPHLASKTLTSPASFAGPSPGAAATPPCARAPDDKPATRGRAATSNEAGASAR